VAIRTSVKDRLIPTLAAAAVVACVSPAVPHFVGHQKVYFGGGTHSFAVALCAIPLFARTAAVRPV
jgi:hypothetical protein